MERPPYTGPMSDLGELAHRRSDDPHPLPPNPIPQDALESSHGENVEKAAEGPSGLASALAKLFRVE
ncbi:MAG: hypothetical protein JWN89_195 [Parcubacteria group bacterium]|nr:hypothetical protein [Parcubacteria group bacterium]